MVAPADRKPGIFGIRDVRDLTTETHEAGHELKRSVSALQLTAMGVGAIIGTGIFVVIGKGAGIAGPGVMGLPRLRLTRRVGQAAVAAWVSVSYSTVCHGAAERNRTRAAGQACSTM